MYAVALLKSTTGGIERQCKDEGRGSAGRVTRVEFAFERVAKAVERMVEG
jgi:hypothetical protein